MGIVSTYVNEFLLFLGSLVPPEEFSNPDIDRSALRGTLFLIAALVALAIAAVCFYFAFRKNKNKKAKKDEEG